MERKEVHYHNTGSGGDGGGSGAMIGLIAGIVLVALGAFLWFGMSDNRNVASGPNVTVTTPGTTGQGGGGGGAGGMGGGASK